MNKPQLSIICAIDKKRGIGKNNKLLVHLSKDLKRFKKITHNHTVIMGLNTYRSIGKPLPRRVNIVLCDDKKIKIPGVIMASTIAKAIMIARKHDQKEIFIIGGASVYNQTINLVDRLYLTIIDKVFDADCFFPDYSKFNKIKSSQEGIDQGLKIRYLILER